MHMTLIALIAAAAATLTAPQSTAHAQIMVVASAQIISGAQLNLNTVSAATISSEAHINTAQKLVAFD